MSSLNSSPVTEYWGPQFVTCHTGGDALINVKNINETVVFGEKRKKEEATTTSEHSNNDSNTSGHAHEDPPSATPHLTLLG